MLVDVVIIWKVLGSDLKMCSAPTDIREAARMVELYIKDRKRETKPRYSFPDMAYPDTPGFIKCSQHAPMSEFSDAE